MYCMGDGRYTKIFLNDGSTMLCARTLSNYEKLLPEESFFRIHKSCIVNFKFIKEFTLNNEKAVILKCNTRLKLARRRSKHFVQRVLESYPSF